MFFSDDESPKFISDDGSASIGIAMDKKCWKCQVQKAAARYRVSELHHKYAVK